MAQRRSSSEKVRPDPPGDLPPDREEYVLEGTSASPGIGIGPVHVLHVEELTFPRIRIAPDRVEEEVDRFRKALERTQEEVGAIQDALKEDMGEDHAKIFDSHLMILQDVMAIENTEKMIREQRMCAEGAFLATLEKVQRTFEGIGDRYLKERSDDIGDLKRRVLSNLLGIKEEGLRDLSRPSIVVAQSLTPSDTAMMDRRKVLGIATEFGGKTSHAAIIARSKGIPAVVGLQRIMEHVSPDSLAVLDGYTGRVVIDPEPGTLEGYREEQEKFAETERQLLSLKDYPAETPDGHAVHLSANIEFPGEIDAVLEHGAQGIGLYRTEYFYFTRSDIPDEEEQYKEYSQVVERIAPESVVFRTLDVGGDKILSTSNHMRERNPFLGWRGIRFSLTRRDIFKQQLRAICRASVGGDVKIMFPMVTGIEEIRSARAIYDEVREELARERFRMAEKIEVGIMVETPSAAAMADSLAPEVDFFSLGTNDLIQYTLAVDRSNNRIGHLYQPLHPAVLRAIREVVEAAHRHGIWVGVCGEMCSDPFYLFILLGMGVDELSMSPYMVPEIKKLIRSVTFDEMKSLVKRVFAKNTVEEIKQTVRDFLENRVPDLPSIYMQ